MLTGQVHLRSMRVPRSPMDRRVKPGDDECFCSRDALRTRVFASRQQKPPLKENRREAERREAHPPGSRIEKRCGARPVSRPPHCGENSRPPGPHGAGALAFRRPTAASEVFTPRLGLRPRFLEPPDANGRTLSGTSAASTSRSGTRRTGRCPSRPRAQCMAAPTRTAPAPPQGVPSRVASLRERDVGDVSAIGIKSRAISFYLGHGARGSADMRPPMII